MERFSQLSKPVSQKGLAKEPQKDERSFRRFSVRRRRKTTRLLTLAPSRHPKHSHSKLNPLSVVIPRSAINRDDNDEVLISLPEKNSATVTVGGFTSTVAHIITAPTDEGQKRGITGFWHVKFPMGIGRIEKLKRKVVSVIMRLRNKPYKSRYFNNPKTLAEREVLAGKMAQLASIRGPSYSSTDWQLNRTPQIEILHNSGQLCVTNKHIYSKHSASEELDRDIVYDGEHNPASAYVMRRFF